MVCTLTEAVGLRANEPVNSEEMVMLNCLKWSILILVNSFFVDLTITNILGK